MSKNIFKVEDWLQKKEAVKPDNSVETKSFVKSDKYAETDLLIQKIEESRIDLTANYQDWRNIGFAIADEFGENGRDFFHRIGTFYADYSTADSDKQFDACLKANGSGINLSTLFYLAKNAGITVSKNPNRRNS
ncbi:MAG: PriCT-2 domain-containing protein [Cytophagaceae bacterium]|nr:PriCT-2 domain-containing protein [Cytophagaceae bacterium]